ncbi:MAG: BON domain-containing protein [Promethearchaeia archaeon]
MKAEKIQQEIMDQLLWDPRIDESNIQVTVKDKSITLSGLVPSHPQKIYAETDVKEVGDIPPITNNIEVIFSPEFKSPSDTEIKEGLEKIYEINSCLDAEKISVSINKGDVILKGVVKSYWEKEMTEKLASEIPSNFLIKNLLTVEPLEPVTDAKIEEQVTTAMERSLRVNSEKVDINVKNGIVTLSGTVSSLSAYSAAEKAAKLSKGVIDVKNNLNYVLRYDIT